MREQPELDVYKVPTDSLVPYANNAKIHTIAQVDQIASSIQEFGFNDPIAVWENADGEREIVEGHGRVLAAEKLGLDVVPVIYLNHLSDAQRRAYTHVHNQLNMNTGWDFEILDAEIEELDFDFEEYGFASGGFDVFDAIQNEDFVSLKEQSEREFFDITLTFDAKYRDQVQSFMKKVGREGLCDIIVEAAGA